MLKQIQNVYLCLYHACVSGLGNDGLMEGRRKGVKTCVLFMHLLNWKNMSGGGSERGSAGIGRSKVQGSIWSS